MLNNKIKNRIRFNKRRRFLCANRDYRNWYRSQHGSGVRVGLKSPHAQPVNYLADEAATARRAARVAEVAKLPRKVVVS